MAGYVLQPVVRKLIISGKKYEWSDLGLSSASIINLSAQMPAFYYVSAPASKC